MALGQVIVRQLELEDRGTVLERWLAHHLAEVIAEVDQSVGLAKEASGARAVDLILKLWAHRRALPESVDPLGGYRKAVEVLGRLVPEANPWARYRGSDTLDELLHEMFKLLSRIVLAGLVFTQVSRARPVPAEESRELEEEEAYLQSVFEQWMPFFPHPQPKSEIKIESVNADAAEGVELDRESVRIGNSDDQDHATDEQAAPDDVRLHAAIVSDLERMQTDLAKLLTRWRESRPSRREGNGENSKVLNGDREATMADPTGVSEGGDVVCEKTGADTADVESTRSDRAHSFWSSSSLTELAEAQGVAPVEYLEDIAALWPSDDNPDDVLAHVLEERTARRGGVRSDPDR